MTNKEAIEALKSKMVMGLDGVDDTKIFEAYENFYNCSKCGSAGYDVFHYCPNCGARMDGEEE